MRTSMRRSGAKRLPVWLAAAFTMIHAAPAAEPEGIRLASDAWPPFTDIAGRPRIAIDLVQEALERAGVRSAATIVERSAVTPGLRDGRFDGSAAIWQTAERESFLLFSEPYLENRLMLVGRSGADVGAPGLSDLSGKRVGVVESYASGDTVDRATGPSFVDGRSDQENLLKLLRGDVDYILVDDLLIRHLLEYQGEETDRFLEIGATPLVRRTLHFAVRRNRRESASIIASFNDAIRTMLADGTYNDILQLNWIRADVDGDGRLELVPGDDRIGEAEPVSGYHVVWPGAAGEPDPAPARFLIAGRIYDGWDSVPDYHKVPAGAASGGLPGSASGLFSFKF